MADDGFTALMSVRARNGLKNLGIATRDALAEAAPYELLRQSNFGRKSLAEVYYIADLPDKILRRDFHIVRDVIQACDRRLGEDAVPHRESWVRLVTVPVIEAREIEKMTKRAEVLRQKLYCLYAEIRDAKKKAREPEVKAWKQRQMDASRRKAERDKAEKFKMDQKAVARKPGYRAIRLKETGEVLWLRNIDAREVTASPDSIYEVA